MRIAIFGAGGVGGYFGGRLAQAGADVMFIARGAHAVALREHGLRIESINGDAQIAPVRVTDDPAQVGPVDMVLVGVKTWQVTEAAHAMRPLLGPDTGVLPLLNGVEAADQLADVLGAPHVLDGICFIFAWLAGPGLVSHKGLDPTIIFGERDNRHSARVEQLRAALEHAGIKVVVPPDIRVAVWNKFLFVVPTGSVGAVTRAPMSIVRSLPETRAMLEAAMREIMAVAQARGIALTEAMLSEALARVDGLPPETTASMQRDIMDGRPSELEAQTGAVLRLGRAAGVPTPTHEFIYHALLPQERTARAQQNRPG